MKENFSSFLYSLIRTFALRMGEFNDIAQMQALLHELQGAAFSRQVESIALHAVFTPYKSDANILIASGEQKSDFDNLLTQVSEVGCPI